MKFAMYTIYDRLAQAIEENRLPREWENVLQRELPRPWNRRTLGGHVPLHQLQDAFSEFPVVCGQPGFYVFGAWIGAEARPQYVGIAHGKPLRKRLCSRYVGGPRSRSTSFELTVAKEFAAEFNRVSDDMSPLTPMDILIEKYRRAGIRLPSDSNRYRRLFRAERWAKIGLDNIWFFLIPARPEATKTRLEMIEKDLILVSNAALFRLHEQGASRAWPLVNIEHGNVIKNPYVEPRLLQHYAAWLAKRSR